MKPTIMFSLVFVLSFSITQTQLSAQEVIVTLEKAADTLNKEDKNILMIFSGSDWCKPCIQLKKEIVETVEFAAFANDNIVVVHLDFPYRKKNKLSKEQQAYNEKMAERYNKEGEFPKVLLLNKNLQVQALIQYKNGMDPRQFIKQIRRARSHY